jgi:hypothetical protein
MMIDPFWTEKLKPLIERDQFIQEALGRKGILEDSYQPELEKIQKENAKKLEKFIMDKGFPVLSNAGEEGVQLSWYIIHNAISYPDFMRECLTQIRLAVAADDFPKDLLAYLEDKVAYCENRKQLFGTHFVWSECGLIPSPIEDIDYLDKRRASFNLPPMADALFKIVHALPPKNPTKTIADFENWLIKIGWRL